MYPGYISIGTDDPFVAGEEVHEVVNNQRAYAYAHNAGICWLNECDACPEAAIIVPGGPTFVSPILDPAPWYVVDNPDSWGFLGVVGIEVTGVEDSTRQAAVTMGLTGGGIIGPTYMGPRTIVVRALAIATDECSLQYGLSWLRMQYNTMVDPCAGDRMTWFDCCPCVCSDDTPGGPCWALNYGELKGDPSACTPTWWPATYADIIAGPPVDDEDWCSWPRIYFYLRAGPPSWSCCVDACVFPYMRQFKNVRVTAGPTVLQHPVLHSPGALAEIEFTIVAADPAHYSVPYAATAAQWMLGTEMVTDPADEPVTVIDPWAVPPELVGVA
jgi:hypothetical protein